MAGFVLPRPSSWLRPVPALQHTWHIIMFGSGYYTVSDQLKAAFAVGLFAWAAWALTAVAWFPIIGLY